MGYNIYEMDNSKVMSAVAARNIWYRGNGYG